MRSAFNIFNPLLIIYIIKENQNLFLHILKRNIASRYKGSILGFVWSFIYPLLMLGVYTFVFGFIFKARWGVDAFDENKIAFPLILFCGMAVFNIFSESINASSYIINANVNYVKKVVFPLELLPLCTVFTSLFFSIAWFILLLVGSLFLLDTLHVTILYLPIVLLPLLFISAGTSFLVSSLGVYLRDTPQLVAVFTQILFFMTPIFYPIHLVPDNIQWLLQLNPLSIIVEQFRMTLLYGCHLELSSYLKLLFFSIIVFQFGLAWFAKTKKGFADVL